MSAPCGNCGNAILGQPFTQGQCRFCWLALHDPKYRALYEAKSYPDDCVHRGKRIGQRSCEQCGSRGQIEPLYECQIHGQCTRSKYMVVLQPEKICVGCQDYKAPTKTIVLNSDAHGFGDAVTMAWVSEGSKDANPRLIHWATGEKRKLLEMFGQEIAVSDVGSVTTFEAYSSELAQRGGKGRVWQRGTYLGIDAEPARPKATIPKDSLDFAAEYRGCVLLYPNTEYGNREWPPVYWLDLYGMLQLKGLRPVMCGGSLDSRYHETRHVFGRSWSDTAAMMSVARLVVSNDSGPMHVAGTLDVPTVALLGPTTEKVCNWMRSVVPIQADREECSCAGCYYHPPSGPLCLFGCVALSHIDPDRVLAEVEKML